MKICLSISSSNNFFFQDSSILKSKREVLISYLKGKEYNLAQIEIYVKVYDYFCKHPEQFDGATMTEDLCDIKGLELAAMIHDYLYIVLNASASLHFIRLADELLFSEMRKMGKSSWNLGYRKFALGAVRRFWVWYCRTQKGRKMTIDNQIEFLQTFQILTQ